MFSDDQTCCLLHFASLASSPVDFNHIFTDFNVSIYEQNLDFLTNVHRAEVCRRETMAAFVIKPKSQRMCEFFHYFPGANTVSSLHPKVSARN